MSNLVVHTTLICLALILASFALTSAEFRSRSARRLAKAAAPRARGVRRQQALACRR